MKSKLYTRTGDAGTTSLADGSRALKSSPRIDAYGDIDELSSYLGFLGSSADCPQEIKDEIKHIQHLLFEIGAYLATPYKTDTSADTVPTNKPEGLDRETVRLEGWIDSLDERTPKIRSFIIPGGTEISSRCHVARTICRRAERRIISLAEIEPVAPEVIEYINRLSDYLFIMARYLNFLDGVEDIAWQKRL